MVDKLGCPIREYNEDTMDKSREKIPLERVDTYRWRIPQSYQPEMHVPGMVYADDELMEQIIDENALQQVANVATLPGIVGYSLGMPDIHWGYGFPVGGVAATHAESGVVSPGGIGFDINCGVRLISTDLSYKQIRKHVDRLADELFRHLPSGVGGAGMLELSIDEIRAVMVRGAAWAVEKGFGFAEDLELRKSMAVWPALIQMSCRAQQYNVASSNPAASVRAIISVKSRW